MPAEPPSFVHQIVGPSHGEEDVGDLLLACHERIRRFVAAALRLASDEEADADDVSATARAVSRYFAEALPLHAEDEDVSLRPRLEAAGFEHDLAPLAHEHDQIDVLLAELLPRWTQVAQRPDWRAAFRQELREATRELASLFERHLAWEEEHVLPAVERLLDEGARREVLAEMRARRGDTGPV